MNLSVIIFIVGKNLGVVCIFSQILRNTSHAKDKVEDACRVTLKNLHVCACVYVCVYVCVCVCVWCAGLAGVCV